MVTICNEKKKEIHLLEVFCFIFLLCYLQESLELYLHPYPSQYLLHCTAFYSALLVCCCHLWVNSVVHVPLCTNCCKILISNSSKSLSTREINLNPSKYNRFFLVYNRGNRTTRNTIDREKTEDGYSLFSENGLDTHINRVRAVKLKRENRVSRVID